MFLDPGWKNDQILEKSTFTSKKLKKSWKKSWKKVEKGTFSWIQDGKMIKF